MKKSLLLTIAAVTTFSCLGLVGCGNTSVADSNTSIVDTHTAMSITNKEALTATWRLGEDSRQISFSFEPDDNAMNLINSGALKIVSSNTAVVSVIGSYISTQSIGSATITASLGALSDSFEVAVAAVDPVSYATKTIEEMITIIGAQTDKVIDKKNVYTVSGTVMNVVNSVYGNFDLYNDDFSKKLTVYGSTTTATALVITKTGGVEDYATFTNPKDFVYGTTVHNGDKITMKVLAEKYGTTNEVMGIIDKDTISLSTTRKTFTASINTPENGTAALSKTSEIYIGEELTVTVTPATDYKVDTVKVNGTSVAADATDATKYVFEASNKNEVVVTFKSSLVSYDYTSLAKYDLSGYSGEAYTANDGKTAGLTDANALAIFNGTETSVVTTGTNCITAVTGNKISQAITSQGSKKGGVKIGNTSTDTAGNYYLTLTTNLDIMKVSITCYGWSTAKLSAVISVNGVDKGPLVADDVTTARTLDFEITASKEIKIITRNAIVVSALELFSGTPKA